MDPSIQPQSPVTPSIDYLNQIAPKTPKRFRLTKMQIIIGSAILLVVAVTITLLAIINGSSIKDPLQHLATRLQSTQSIVSDAQSKIKSTQLRALNSNLKIYLTNTNRDIVGPLSTQNIDVNKIDKAIVSSETGKDVTDRLENARLNAVYDRTYAREIAYRLGTILALMQQVNDSTSSKSLKSFLGDAIKNLEPSQKSFEDFNATNG